MKRKRLGRSGMVVPDICMGTMTFGLQADEKTSFAIMGRAIDVGIDFFDTAEMYPVPPSAEFFGVTALSVGWSKQHGFVASTIIGATTVAQLEESLKAADVVLDEETIRRINEIDEEIPNPMTEDGLRRL